MLDLYRVYHIYIYISEKEARCAYTQCGNLESVHVRHRRRGKARAEALSAGKDEQSRCGGMPKKKEIAGIGLLEQSTTVVPYADCKNFE